MECGPITQCSFFFVRDFGFDPLEDFFEWVLVQLSHLPHSAAAQNALSEAGPREEGTHRNSMMAKLEVC